MNTRPLSLIIASAALFSCAVVGFAATLGTALLWHAAVGDRVYAVADPYRYRYADSPVGPQAATSPLSGVFTDEVLYWTPLIQAWAVLYQVDPNLIATLIQIESCGDPSVSSPAGAQGLFQVMPFHFAPGEDMLDVATNARRGMEYLVGGLEVASGHAGLALAGYNGGHGVINRGWATWAAETQRYYSWGSRLYMEAASGMATSPTLDEWLAAGGDRLCAQARQTQTQLEAANRAQVMVIPGN
ncbi:MAG: lytic transglycosylase domain-containing protein [Anaerolineae bacterium]|nr:lytic transglycosylase domain-containing protein [Anaerolineae bacterium]